MCVGEREGKKRERKRRKKKSHVSSKKVWCPKSETSRRYARSSRPPCLTPDVPDGKKIWDLAMTKGPRSKPQGPRENRCRIRGRWQRAGKRLLRPTLRFWRLYLAQFDGQCHILFGALSGRRELRRQLPSAGCQASDTVLLSSGPMSGRGTISLSPSHDWPAPRCQFHRAHYLKRSDKESCRNVIISR